MEMLREEAFVDKTRELLIDYGEIRDCELCSWQGRGFKIDAYEMDEDFENLTLIVSHWLDVAVISQTNVTNSEINRVFRRAVNFFRDSYQGKLKDRIDPSNPAQELAELIYDCRKDLTSVKLILITDGVAKERRGEIEVVDEVELTRAVWDIQTASFIRQKLEKENRLL